MESSTVTINQSLVINEAAWHEPGLRFTQSF